MAISRLDMNRQLYDEGGIITLDQAKEMAPPGESLAYINPEEAALLKSLGGAGEDINGTGIKSYFLKKIFRKAKKAVKKVVKSPIGKAAIIGGLGYLGAKSGAFKGLLGGIKNMGLGKQLGLIGGISSLGGYLASKEAEEEEEPDFSNLDRGETIDYSDVIRRARKNDPEFRFLPGAGFTEAYAEGGEVNKTISMIKDMLNRGMDDSTISSITGASQEEINIIKTKKRQDKAEGGIMKAKRGLVNEPGSYAGKKLKDVDKMSRRTLVKNLNSLELPETNASEFDDNNIRQILIDFAPDIFKGSWGSNSYAKGGEVAEGGIMNLGGNEMDLRGGGFVPLGAKEKADDVPARLSKNEFVMTADAVRAAGGGSVDKGADKMYSMMKNLESQV